MGNEQIYEDEEGGIYVNFGGQSRAQQVIQKRSREITNTEYPSGIDLASGYPKSLIWTTRDGRRIAIPNMSDDHLLKTLAWLRSRVPFWKRRKGFHILLKHLTITSSMLFQDMSDDTQQDISSEMSGDYEHFMSLSEKEFLEKYVPIYGRMYQEAYKRKLLT